MRGSRFKSQCGQKKNLLKKLIFIHDLCFVSLRKIIDYFIVYIFSISFIFYSIFFLGLWGMNRMIYCLWCG